MAALITPEELIVYLDLPANTQPTDRAQLVCTLVIDDVAEAAGTVPVEPFPAGVRTVAFTAAARLYVNPALDQLETIDDYTVRRGAVEALTVAERAKVTRAYGSGGRPLYSFPEPDWSWAASTSTVSSD